MLKVPLSLYLLAFAQVASIKGLYLPDYEDQKDEDWELKVVL